VYRIISLNGGGIRGVVEVILLGRLISEVPKLLEKVDLLTGTSTGGIIALALAAGVPLSRIRELYETKGKKIFLPYSPLYWGIATPKYSNVGLETLLREILGDKKLGDLSVNVCIPSFDLDNGESGEDRMWKVKVFHNFPGKDSDHGMFAYDVALATSAAPTFFPSHKGYIDGGVVMNNPAMAALSLIRDRRIRWSPPQDGEVHVLSLGCGIPRQWVESEDVNWGMAQWLTRLLDILMDGALGVVDYQCRQLLSDRYHSLSPFFPKGEDYKLDDYKNVHKLVDFAQRVDISSTVAWLKNSKWEE